MRFASNLSTNPLIARAFFGSHWGIPPTHTINVDAYLTLAAVGTTFLTSLAMTRFGPNIEPITFPTPPSGCATCYVTELLDIENTHTPTRLITSD